MAESGPIISFTELLHSDIAYDPVRLNPDGCLFNRIDLEKIWDKEHGAGKNPHNGMPFHINDIQPQTGLRRQLRRYLIGQLEEYNPDQNCPRQWQVIPDYPFEMLDMDHMRCYLNELTRWISANIHIPNDLKNLWKSINLLRLNCQYSDANTDLFRSVNGFRTLIEALSKHFNIDGLKYDGVVEVHKDETLNLCREIVKLAEITGLSTEDARFITHRELSADAFCGILRLVYYEGGYRKDMSRIVRITHAMFNDVQLPYFDHYFKVILSHLWNPDATSKEINLCADISNGFLGPVKESIGLDWSIYPLCQAFGTLVSRFYSNNDEFGDRSTALENVMKVLCRLCVKFGVDAVEWMSLEEMGMLAQVKLILEHALSNMEPEAATFSGRHLLFALLIARYIIQSPAGDRASPEDLKVILDFSMSALATRYVFNGRPKLQILADQVASVVLDCQAAEIVLPEWPRF